MSRKVLVPLNMGGNQVNNAGNGAASTDLATIGQVPAWLNVTSKGADPTGSADSTSAAQAAITALSAFGGGFVYFPTGTWKLTPASATVPALTVPSNITLAGDGIGATTLLKNGNGPLIDFSGAGPISQTQNWNKHQGLRDLAVNGNGMTGLLLRLYYVQFYYESNVYLYGNADVSVDMVQCFDSRVTNGLYLNGGSPSASAISGAQAVFHLIRNSAAPATTLSAGISGTVTSLPVAALPAAMPAGIVQVWNADGQVQNFTTTGAANGATSIPVTSAAVAYTFLSGNAVNGFGWSGDSTNALVMEGCHWETNLSGAVWVTRGVDNSSQLNSVYISNSKCEQDAIGYNCAQIQVDPGCADVKIDGLYFYAGPFNAGYSTAVPGIYFHPDYGALNNVYQLNGSAATIATGVDAGTSSGFRVTCTNVFQFWNTSPTVAGFNGTAGQPFLTNFQVNGTVTTPFAGTYSLINDGNGNWAFAGAGVVGGITGFGPYVLFSQSAPGATADASSVYADTYGNLSNVNPAGLTSLLQQSQYAASASIGNVTTETALVSLSVPENDPIANAVYKLSGLATATISTTAPTITFRLRWGGTSGTVLAVTTAISTTASKTGGWEFEGTVIFTSATQAVAKLKITSVTSPTTESPGEAGTATVTLAVSTTATTVTVSSAESLVLTAAFSATDSQSLTAYGYAERVA